MSTAIVLSIPLKNEKLLKNDMIELSILSVYLPAKIQN